MSANVHCTFARLTANVNCTFALVSANVHCTFALLTANVYCTFVLRCAFALCSFALLIATATAHSRSFVCAATAQLLRNNVAFLALQSVSAQSQFTCQTRALDARLWQQGSFFLTHWLLRHRAAKTGKRRFCAPAHCSWPKVIVACVSKFWARRAMCWASRSAACAIRRCTIARTALNISLDMLLGDTFLAMFSACRQLLQ